jgi:hypothetical protein
VEQDERDRRKLQPHHQVRVVDIGDEDGRAVDLGINQSDRGFGGQAKLTDHCTADR